MERLKLALIKRFCVFDFKARKAFYIDEDKRKHELTVDYIREYDNPIMPILKYIGKSYAVHGVNKEHLAKLFKACANI